MHLIIHKYTSLQKIFLQIIQKMRNSVNPFSARHAYFHPIKALLPGRTKLTRPRPVTAGRGLGKPGFHTG